MMSFTKILWAGSKHILITESELSNKVLALLDCNDIQRLNSEWGEYIKVKERV